MQVLLRIANGKSNVRKVRIQSDTVIGRSPECQLKVASNQISRRHCQIVIRDTVVAIKDLGSANGTFVNGRQVPPEVEIPLTPGTRVMLGPLQFTVEYDLPGMPAVAGSAPAETVASEAAAETPMAQVAVVEPQLQPQVHVETLQVVPPDGQTPFPPFVVVPPQQVPAQQIPPQYSPPVVAPAAVAAPPAAPINHVVVPQAPLPVPAAIPAPVVAMAAPVIAPPAATVMMASPFAQPPASPAAAAPAAPEFFQPGADATLGDEQEDTGGFNFGIFAASGSDVVVESAAEITMVSEPNLSEPPKPEPPKPAKKGLLQMFGWGKKKAPAPEPEATPDVAAEPEGIIADEESPVEDVPEGEGLVFEIPVAEDAAVADDSSPDESLQNFFNNFK